MAIHPIPWDRARVARRVLAACLLAFVLGAALAACGESSSDKAKKQVCSASADIKKQVTTLQGLTPTTATTSAVKDSVNAITDDLTTIKDATPKLASDLKSQVQSANQEFTSQVQSVLSDLGKNISISNAGTQLKTATNQLATSYQQTFAKIGC
jgi:regulatory protein YycI of two-component signal transduction system YycFG